MTERTPMLLLDKTDIVDLQQRDVTFRPPEPIFDADDELQLCVIRHRDSNGFAAITLCFGKDKIEFNSDLTPGYEIVTRCAAELLLEAVDHGCRLPRFQEAPEVKK